MGQIEYPITVNKIEFIDSSDPIRPDRIYGAKPGSWVSVRPVGNDKTYLGIMLGDYEPPMASFHPETGVLTIAKSIGNPAMWVPDLGRVIMGWGSWWGEIKSPNDLHQISDADIQNVWYVKAIKDLAEAAKTAESEPQPA
jgi:hypothetical protein